MTSDPTNAARDAVAATGDGLTALGLILLSLAAWHSLTAFEVLPAEVRGYWPAALLVGAMWLAVRGRRVAAMAVTAVAAGLLVIIAVPGEFFWPALLVVAGTLLVLAAAGGRRLFDDLPDLAGTALFGDRDLRLVAGAPARPLVAVFGEVDGVLEGAPRDGDRLSCLAVFGSTTLTVPADAEVVLRPLAVFGDVRSPAPPTGTGRGEVVQVRGTALFGDVRIRRA